MHTYLPLWTTYFPDPEQQYHLGWIYASTSHDPRYALLPIRYYGRGQVFEDRFHHSYTVNHYYAQETGWHWLQTEIKPALYYFAEQLYIKAAQQVFETYPELSDISFMPITKEGIYPIQWKIPYKEILCKLKCAIQDIYDSGFSVDETIEEQASYDDIRNASTVKISGVLDGSATAISEWFYKQKPGNYRNRELKKNLRYSLSDCYELYRIFSEEELCLGNQTRIYTENKEKYAAEFKAADESDFDKLVAYGKNGFDLNTMGRWGETAFSRFCDSGEATVNFEQLDTLISLGANPALYGCEFDEAEAPLWIAAFNCDVQLVAYLLSKGVDPRINTDTSDIFGEFLIHRIERWSYDCNGFQDERRKIVALLKQYSV